MASRRARFVLLGLAAVPFVSLYAQDPAAKPAPTCEQVFKDIKVFKGMPATELIPMMEFMSGSLKYQCEDCHDPKDYSAPTGGKDAAREMVTMQKEINDKNFGGRVEVTCMTCHHGAEHPLGVAIPDGMKLRHERLSSAPKPEELFTKAMAVTGRASWSLVRTGTLTAPNDMTHKEESKDVKFIQGDGGKFLIETDERKISSDGAQVWYGGFPMTDEPAAVFMRIGRAWRGDSAYAGLSDTLVSGKDSVDKVPVLVVRGARKSTNSTEEMYFDEKTNLLLRMTNARRTPIGTVVSAIDYSNYKDVNGMKVPMKVVVTFAGDEKWTMEFKDVKVDSDVKREVFNTSAKIK